MSVRIMLWIILAAPAGVAHASSLVFPGAPSAAPSVIRIEAPRQSRTAEVVKTRDARSIDEAQPDVTNEKVAAIPKKPEARHGFQPGPTVIRGGIVGSAFSAPMPTNAPAADTAPGTATASDTPSDGAGDPSNPPPSEPAQAQAQPLPASSKTR